jgi:hypothetical protein
MAAEAIGGPGATAALDRAMATVESLALSTLGDAVHLGLTRVLTTGEIDEVLLELKKETALLQGLVVEQEPTPENFERTAHYGDQLRRIEIAVGTVGHARVLCHPEAFVILKRIDALRDIYGEWVREQNNTSRNVFEARIKATFEEIERRASERAKSRKPTPPSAPASQAMNHAPYPVQGATPERRLWWRLLVGFLAIALVGLLLARRLKR